MIYRRAVAVILATIFGLVGAIALWTAIWYLWFFQFAIFRSGSADSQVVPVPGVGMMAMYYLIPLGVLPAVSIMLALGTAALLLAYIVVRRSH
jgi:hypothetical protein